MHPVLCPCAVFFRTFHKSLEADCPSCQQAHGPDGKPCPLKEEKKGTESRKAQMSQAVSPKTVGLVFHDYGRAGVEGVFGIV